MELILKYFSGLTQQQIQQLAALENLYKEWNEKINVISRKDIDSLYENHILHSLSIAAVFNFSGAATIIDIGTGGGFPGVPLAIFFPQAQFHLVDSIGKKLKAVEAISAAIGLTNVTTQHIRAEEINHQKFDFAVSRAVAPLKELWRWSRPLLKNSEAVVRRSTGEEIIRSGLICLKGGDLSKEISESGVRPRTIAISELFEEAYFKEKYVLYVASPTPPKKEHR